MMDHDSQGASDLTADGLEVIIYLFLRIQLLKWSMDE